MHFQERFGDLFKADTFIAQPVGDAGDYRRKKLHWMIWRCAMTLSERVRQPPVCLSGKAAPVETCAPNGLWEAPAV